LPWSATKSTDDVALKMMPIGLSSEARTASAPSPAYPDVPVPATVTMHQSTVSATAKAARGIATSDTATSAATARPAPPLARWRRAEKGVGTVAGPVRASRHPHRADTATSVRAAAAGIEAVASATAVEGVIAARAQPRAAIGRTRQSAGRPRCRLRAGLQRQLSAQRAWPRRRRR